MSETEYSIGKNCGVTFAGIKPASMVSIKKSGKKDLGKIAGCFKKRNFEFCSLKENNDRFLVLTYQKDALNKVLFSKENKEFLESCGYAYDTAEEAIRILKNRMKKEDFPHEIGVFLGYPLVDVKGFIASPTEGLKLSGYWKVYSDEEKARKTFATFRRCSDCICKKMSCGQGLAQIFGVG